MKKLKQLLEKPHLQVELTLGASIIALAYVSAVVLTEPISYLEMSICGIIMGGYEALARSKKNANAWFIDPAYWIAAILVATALIIMRHMV
jgi:hypothetical protein